MITNRQTIGPMMPELPEVEMFKRYIEAHGLNMTIARTVVDNPRVVASLTVQELRKRTELSKFISARRHGKHLFLGIYRGGWLTWHFGMTGEPVYYEDEDVPRFSRVRFLFNDGALAFSDPRMLGRIGWTPSVDEYLRLRGVGPDALAVSKKEFLDRMSGRRMAIKPALMDQHRVAGVGNLYADEILFQSRVDPRQEVAKMDREDLERIYRNMRMVLRRSIERGADLSALPRDYLLPYRSKGGRCPLCGGTINTVTLGGRTTYLCPSCQMWR